MCFSNAIPPLFQKRCSQISVENIYKNLKYLQDKITLKIES